MQSMFPPNSPYTLEQFSENAHLLMKEFYENCHFMGNSPYQSLNWQEPLNISHIFQKWGGELNEGQIFQLGFQMMQDYMALGQQVQAMMMGAKVEPMVAPASTDRRFKASEWQDNPFFFFFQQAYLLFVKHTLQFINQNPSQDPKITKQVSFFTRQYLDALAPTNFIWTNPAVLEKTLTSSGENLIKGAQNFIEDVVRGQGVWNIKMTDLTAFEVGKDVAITKGKVIFQNRLIQLIQYQPATKQVFKRPLLIVPPCINKYYILDLRENNSFVKWAVDQGLTVFMISWVNPDSSLRNVSFEDYIFEGVLAALGAVIEETQEEQVNALGFCIGGTLLAATLAYMKQKNDQRIASATFLTTLIDFFDPGEIEAFIDDEQLKSLEKRIETTGYMDGRLLMMAFNLLRANELFWPYYIDNYLKGKSPVAFDLLYWNSDSTHLPAKMASDYLRQINLENRLAQPGAFRIAGIPLDMTQVKTPSYFLSTELDHIAPWQTTLMGARYFQGPLTFVLGGSGHIAGVINPPCNNKYGYWCSKEDVKKVASAQDWLATAVKQEGSWWEHWLTWINTYAGEQIKARTPGKRLSPIQEAPGDYVKKRLF